MTEDKLRIPRVGLAVLVLGAAACGDDSGGGSGNNKADGGGSDASIGRTRKDGGGLEHLQDAGAGNVDAGGDEDDGGSADEDAGAAHADGSVAHDGGSVDTSSARIQKVASDFCKNAFACKDEQVLMYYMSEAMCASDLPTYWHDYETTYGADCLDAVLDLYSCYADASCAELDTACNDESSAAEQLCAPSSP